jgi:hypothetical protein
VSADGIRDKELPELRRLFARHGYAGSVVVVDDHADEIVFLVPADAILGLDQPDLTSALQTLLRRKVWVSTATSEWDKHLRSGMTASDSGPSLHGTGRFLPDDVRSELQRATQERLREIAVAAASAALAGVGEFPSELASAVSELRSGLIITSTAARVQKLAEQLDDRYLGLKDERKPGGQSPDWEQAFFLARAGAAVSHAFDADRMTAATQSIYEALHALNGDVGAIRAAIRLR